MSKPNHPLSPELCHLFVTLIQHDGSLIKTAKTLEESVPNLSKRLKPLLRGSPDHAMPAWLDKSGKRYVLTDEGRAMLPAATEHSEKWMRFTSFTSTYRPTEFTVACGQESAGGVVLRAATAFRTRHPETPLNVAVVRGKRRIEGVAAGQYDVAFVTHNPVAIQEIARVPVQIQPLADDPLVMACAADSQWKPTFDKPKPVTLADLQKWPLVLPEADSAIRKQWDTRIRELLETPLTVAIEIGGWRVMLDYVLAGFGVGLLPTSVAKSAEAQLLTRPLPDSIRPSNRLQIVTLPATSNAGMKDDFLRGCR